MSCFNLLFGLSVSLFVVSLANTYTNAAVSVSDNVYVVYMGGKTTSLARNDHTQLLSELMERKKGCVVQTYSRSFLGFAARLTEEEVKSTSERPGVVSIFPDKVSRLHTTRSWDFLKSSSQNAASYKNHEYGSTISHSKFSGSDTIIGILDTGIWPEHESFNDKKMGPIPQRWKGECLPGRDENSTSSFECNKKLIGARYYEDPLALGSITTPRDFDGHGTLVASVAAGRPIRGASYYGLARGVAMGGSPGSRIAAYRVCGPEGCRGSSILKAFDDAIGDGVDVLSVSFGGNTRYLLTNPVAIGAFHAAEKGIVVLCSGGNSGPSPGTVANVAPWIVTVGATTIDRDFEVDIVLGHGEAMIKGGGIAIIGLNKSAVYHLVDGRSGNNNASSLEGTIVVCDSVSQCLTIIGGQGAKGGILIGDDSRQSVIDFGLYTVAAVSDKDGDRILSYINSTSNPLATILPTRVTPKNYKPSPVVAVFSSRGPGFTNILKPDITAPGVGILGAWRLNTTSLCIPGKEPPLFYILSGTSFSCPHVSGLVAKLRSRYPKWSPSAIKSAIMTTAIQQNNLHTRITTFNGSRATPYDIGAGEINLFRPFSPGLVYETEITDYIQFICNMGYKASVIRSIATSVLDNFSCPSDSSPDLISNMNYPSIAISGLNVNGTRTVKRTVTNVGEEFSRYTAHVEAPACMQVQVVPNKLQFNKSVKKLTFQVTFIILSTTTTPDHQEHLFGSITWFSRTHEVRSPFVVTMN